MLAQSLCALIRLGANLKQGQEVGVFWIALMLPRYSRLSHLSLKVRLQQRIQRRLLCPPKAQEAQIHSGGCRLNLPQDPGGQSQAELC